MLEEPESIPPDDLSRTLTIARPDEDRSLPHIGLVGDTYTILVAGKDTAGKFALIDMHVPPGGGPPPHRHDVASLDPGTAQSGSRDHTRSVQAGDLASIRQRRSPAARNSAAADISITKSLSDAEALHLPRTGLVEDSPFLAAWYCTTPPHSPIPGRIRSRRPAATA